MVAASGLIFASLDAERQEHGPIISRSRGCTVSSFSRRRKEGNYCLPWPCDTLCTLSVEVPRRFHDKIAFQTANNFVRGGSPFGQSIGIRAAAHSMEDQMKPTSQHPHSPQE